MKLVFCFVNPAQNGTLADLAEDYNKRLAKLGRALGYSGFDICAVKSGPTREREARNILVQLEKYKSGCIIGLDETGKMFTSVEVSTALARIQNRSDVKSIVFVVGGADGFSHSLRKRFNETWSLGQMTWPHQLVHVMILEQVYRAFSIAKGHPYHRS